MFKYFIIFFAGLLLSQNVLAQKADTSIFYKKNSGEVVSTRDSADYIMVIVKPDSAAQYTINEYYINGKRKLSETALYNNGKFNDVILTGPCVEFFPSGVKKKIVNYINGYISGDIFLYYPNGKLYSIEKSARGMVLLGSCRDSTGKVLAENGKGDWVQYTSDFQRITEQGKVEDSLKTGEWHGNIGDTGRYVITYKKGVVGPGTGYDANNKAYHFTTYDNQAYFKGPGTYLDFIRQNLHYPSPDKENNVQGKVIIQFLIAKNGSTSNFTVLRAPDKNLSNEAIRVIKLMKWNPCIMYGIPMDSKFTLPINFTVSNGR